MSLRSFRGRPSPLPTLVLAIVVSAGAALAPLGGVAAAPGDEPGGGEPGEMGDFAPPTITVDYPPGSVEGWFNKPVDVQIALSDVAAPGQYASGIDFNASYAQLSGADNRRVNLRQLNTRLSFTVEGSTKVNVYAQDHEGNYSQSEFYVGIDRVAPTLTLAGPLRSGAHLRVGTEVRAQYSCWDAHSGVAECTGTFADGDVVPTDVSGHRTAVFRAVDPVGNVREVEFDYWVVIIFDVLTPAAIEGTPRVGEVLTGVDPVFSRPGRLYYAWKRDGKLIDGEVGKTYRVTEEDEGAEITFVTVAYLNGDGTYVPGSSTASVQIENPSGVRVRAAAQLQGEPRVGERLTGVPAEFDVEAPHLRHVWYRDDKVITWATGPVYTVVPQDAGRRIRYETQASRTGEAWKSSSSPAMQIEGEPVPDPALAVLTEPTVAGTPQVGQRLTATPAVFYPRPTATRHVWLRDGAPIPGATGAGYLLTAADAGRTIQYATEGTLGGDSWTRAASRVLTVASSAGSAGSIVAQGAVSVAGVARVGQVLSATPPGFAGLPSGARASLAYQWLRDGQPVAGATGATYRLTVADTGRRLSVRVTASHPGLTSAVVTSAASAVVAKATPKVKVKATAAGAGAVRLTATVSAVGVPKASVTGKVVVRRGKVVVARGTVKAGRVVLTLKRQPRTTSKTIYTVAYQGAPALAKKTSKVKVGVR